MTQTTLQDKVITIKKVDKSSLSDKLWYIIPSVLLVGLLIILIYRAPGEITVDSIISGLDSQFFLYLVIGIIAQMVDGTLGMGYGATTTSFLLANGVPPVVSSTAIHIAEMFTTGTSTIANHKFGNINKKLAYYLIIPGVIGSILGATVLSNFIDQDKIKPFVAIYMIILASIILRKGLRTNTTAKKKKTKKLGYLAIFGGFMDSVGGGGWGPIVTSTLVGRGRNPVYTIASVNAAEFTIAFASGITFLLFQGINGWQVICGLILGGVIAAPIAASLLPKIPRREATIAVAILIFILSIRTLIKYI
jgi:uncharacterized protein